jgi:hypothetical protein
MQNQIETQRSIKTMNRHHEAVLIFIRNLNAVYIGLGQEPGVIGNRIAAGVLKKRIQIFAPDSVDSTL